MTNDLLAVFEYFEKEKGIDRATMIDALQNALLTASRKSIGPARDLRIDINADKGTIKAICSLMVVDKVQAPYEEIDLATARKIKPGAEIDDEIEVEVTPADFGRIAAQTARQAMMQRLRQAEKEMIYDEFKDRAGDIVSGTIRRFERSDVVIDLGKFEGSMSGRDRVSTEDYNIGDRIRAYVVAVENGPRGPEIILSRSHPNFVKRLFEAEVSEVADRTVELRAIAREAGYRTKVAVHSEDEKVDPVGACVGLRGARVKNIVRELNNEKVDIIRYSPNIEEFVADALKPAALRSIRVDEDEHRVHITVDEAELSKAIGRRGQNARLTSQLVGWDVQIDKDAQEQFEAKVQEAIDAMIERTELSHEIAVALVTEGIIAPEMLVGLEAGDLVDAIDIDEGQAQAIINQVTTKLSEAGSSPTAEEEAPAAEAAEEAPEAVEEVPETKEETPAAPEEAPEAAEEKAPEAVEEETPTEEESEAAATAEEKETPDAEKETAREAATG